MLSISTQSDYGLLMISYLLRKDAYVPVSELVMEMKLPQRYLARIAAELAKNNVLVSREGKVGGYKLTDKAKSMNLYDYLKIFEGEVSIARCDKEEGFVCQYSQFCHHRGTIRNAFSKILSKELKKQKLLTLFH